MGKYRHWILIGGGAAVAVILAVVVTLYVLGGRGTGSGGGFFDRLTSGLSTVTSSLAPTKAEAVGEFAFHRVDIDTSQPQAAACLVFTRDLDVSGRTHYVDYFDIDPATRVAVHIVGSRLCLSGLDFNKTYTVTLKAGLPSASGDKLVESETVPVELRDKPSIVQFNGGIILPRENAQGVPITTVNVTKVKLKLIRVGDRLLSQIESGTVDQTTLYSWSAKEIENNQGSLVWQGTMDVGNVKNDSVVTLIPIHNVLKNRKPGAYVLIASDANKKSSDDSDEGYSSGEMAVQWVIDSDIALTTFNGAGGMTVFARSYASAKPLSGVRLSLVARDNNEVATVKTNSDGRADFDAGLMRAKGGDEPVVVMAYGNNQDFSFTDLRRSSFDLTDRGVSGREVPGPVDAYLYTERGVYRPGETVYLTAMLRDRVGAAAVAPLTLVATRPDGLEVGRTTVPGASLKAGTAIWTLPLSSSAPHGRWQIAAYIDPKDVAIGRVQFDVQDFVPQKLKVTLTAETKVARQNSEIKVRADSRFLYGAPASGLSGEGVARISVDPTPFDNYAGWQFGRVDDSFSDVDVQITVPTTDANGSTEATGAIGALTDTTLALKAMVKISIHEPGGRVTAKTVDIPVRNHEVMIGIRAQFSGMSVAEGARAELRSGGARRRRQAYRAFRRHLFLGARRHLVPMVPGQWQLEVQVGHARPVDYLGHHVHRHGRVRQAGAGDGRGAPIGSPSPIRNRAPPAPSAIIPAGRHRAPATDPTASRSRRTGPLTARAKPRMCASSPRRTARRWSWWPATRCSLRRWSMRPRAARPSTFPCRPIGARAPMCW